MTSTSVNVQGFATGMVYTAGCIQTNDTTGDFSRILENQKNNVENVADNTTTKRESQKEKDVDGTKSKDKTDTAVSNTNEQSEDYDVQKSGESKQEKPVTDENAEEGDLSQEQIMETLQSAVVDVRELLTQSLQVSEEELQQLMQDMNLTDTDLLQADNVKALMLEAMGAEDMTAVLTDEGLYTQMKEADTQFTDILKSVQEALDMEPQEVDELVRGFEETPTVKSDAVENDMAAQDGGQISVTVEEVVEQKDSENEQGFTKQDETNPFLNQQQQTDIQTQNSQSGVSETTGYTTVDTQDIMNQIMDFMKVQTDAESTQLEMQLHPESLGTLQIRISAKEGIMTAQFTTTSEAVKSVLETQMVQLQQQFDQQNIKVEAIEITVQTHAFESALEQGNERQTAEEGSKKNKTRKIDLSQLEEPQELETEDRIVAEMMAANGNSVDYLA